MEAIDDVRKLLQDFVAPQIHGIHARLDGIDKRLDGIDKRFDGMDKRFDGIGAAIKEGDDRVLKAVEQAQREILLTLKLAQAEQRNAEYEKQAKAIESKPTH